VTRVAVLGRVARTARASHLGKPLAFARDTVDRVAWRPLLTARAPGVELHGFMRHRSFLADVERGGYEAVLRALLERALTPGATFVDGGAHIGYWTLLASRLVGADGDVVSFEPDPYNARALRWNVARAQLGNVETHEEALADRPGQATVYAYGSTISTSLARRGERFGAAREVAVRVTSVDAALAARPLRRVVVKLDLEGCETPALQGVRETARRAGELVLVVEVNPDALRDAGSSPGALVAGIRALGLEPRFVDETTGSLLPLGDPAGLPKGNLYASREAATT